jgi:c-di-GMP-binding flagellar brake protein YcgR
MKSEKRKFKRFAMKDKAFVVFRPDFKKLGKIRNISKGGLACEYLTCGGVKEHSAQLEIDLVLSSGKFYLSMIPCKAVYDFKMAEDSNIPNMIIENRRCGLRFLELSKEKNKQLMAFLESHAISTMQRIKAV